MSGTLAEAIEARIQADLATASPQADDPWVDDPHAATGPPQVRKSLADIHPAARMQTAVARRFTSQEAHDQ